MTTPLEAALIEARDPATSPERLQQLSKWPHHEDRSRLRQIIAANPNVGEELLWDLASDYPDQAISNPRFQLLLVSNEPWWQKASSSALLQLTAALGRSTPEAARNHLVQLIWQELSESSININLEAHQHVSVVIRCELPATRDGFLDLLSIIGALETPEGGSIRIKKWSGATLGKIQVLRNSIQQGSDTAHCSIQLDSKIAVVKAGIIRERGLYRCDSLDLISWDSTLWPPEDYETPEDREILEREILERLVEDTQMPLFSVSLSCIVENNYADLKPVGSPSAPLDSAELLSVIRSLGLKDGSPINLEELPDFDFEIDYVPGGQGYWEIESVDSNRMGWSFNESIDGFGAGSITATGPSGTAYEQELTEPGQNQEFKNATLKESLAWRLCDGHFSDTVLRSLLEKAL